MAQPWLVLILMAKQFSQVKGIWVFFKYRGIDSVPFRAWLGNRPQITSPKDFILIDVP